ncbi:MAG: Transcription factor spt20 [Alectoria sarmentosa]|nr:MAG: Transcription factor spt20 [Alectoria sarmentosa]
MQPDPETLSVTGDLALALDMAEFSGIPYLNLDNHDMQVYYTAYLGTRQQHTSSLTLQRPLLFNDSLYHISNSSHVVNIYPEQSALRQPGLLAHKIPPLILAAGAGEWQEFAKENMEMNEGEHKHTSGAPFTLTVMAMPVRWFPLIRQSSAITPTMMPLQTLAIDPRHQQSLPAPKTKKRTVAELAADEAIAAQEQAFMLIMDERHNVSGPAAKAGTTDGEAGTATFEPRFETWQAIKKIRAEHKERAEREAEAKAQLADILTYIQADLGKGCRDFHITDHWDEKSNGHAAVELRRARTDPRQELPEGRNGPSLAVQPLVVSLQEVMVEHNGCFVVFEYLSHDLAGLLNHPILAEDLLATIRKENGTVNLSSIAQGREPSANASPAYHANGAPVPIPRHGFEQTPTGFQGYVQPVSVPTRKSVILSSITRIRKTLQQHKRGRPA